MKKLITEQFVIDIIKSGANTIEICENCLLTPLAKDRINSAGIKIVKKKNDEKENQDILPDNNKIAIGGDHTGFEVKEILNCLEPITGTITNSELLDKIFEDFCIGK